MELECRVSILLSRSGRQHLRTSGRQPWRRAKRRSRGGVVAMTNDERIRAVIDCGFTERQARFLV
jgi:hypothetical protein